LNTLLNREKIYRGAWLVFYLLLIVSPVFFLFVETASQLIAGNTEWLSLAWPQGRRLQLLARSTAFSSLVALGGGLLGILAGSFLSDWQPRRGKNYKYMVLVLAVVPPYIHALAWTSTFRYLNTFLSETSLPELPVYGFFISWWVQMMALAPFAVGMALLGFALVDPALVDAGRVIKDDFYVFRKILFPVAAPAIAAGSAFMFLISLMDYSVPTLYQVSTYSLEIFAEYSASYEPARAFLLSLPLLMLMVLAAAIFQAAFRSTAMSSRRVSEKNVGSPLRYPWWFNAARYVAVFIMILQVTVPVVSLFFTTGSWDNLVRPIEASAGELGATLIIAGCAALLSLPLAMVSARQVNEGGVLNNFWWPVLILSLTVPAPLIGIGIIHLWNQGFLVYFYRSLLMPVLAGVIRFIPFAVFIMLARYKREDPLLLDAAAILQKSPLHTLILVKLPMFGKALLASAAVVFILTAGELGATLLVVPPRQGTLTIKIFNYMHYGESASVAGLSLIMLIMSLVLGVTIIALLRGRSKETLKP